MHRRKLPIGIQNFWEIRSSDYVYVDKTEIAHALIEGGKYYFLARPRRFGKSLFLDTLKCIFEGRQELFTGLYIAERRDWSRQHPVIHLSFGGGVVQSREQLSRRIMTLLRDNRERLGLTCRDETDIPACFAELIRCSAKAFGQRPAVLVDEYDKPILDNILNPEVARDIRDGLRDLYSVIKDADAHIEFAFLTGVSKFSKMNLFSGLNNLNDISLDPRYAAICGYTQAELERHFREHLAGVDLVELQRWYNGYNFLGEMVYNPFDILLFFDKGKIFQDYWFATGTPTFLMDLIREKHYYLPDFNRLEVSRDLLDTFEVDRIPIEALMHQTGYLTIKEVRESRISRIRLYTLDFPNFEVRHSFMSHLAGELTGNHSETTVIQDNLYGILEDGELAQLETAFKRLLASISYSNYTKNNLDRYEGYYASVIFAYLYSLGLPMSAEDTGSKGRADLIIRLPDKSRAYILEFKVIEEDDQPGSALAQIKAQDYAARLRGEYRQIHLVGIEFSKAQRNIVNFQHENLL